MIITELRYAYEGEQIICHYCRKKLHLGAFVVKHRILPNGKHRCLDVERCKERIIEQSKEKHVCQRGA